MKYIKAVLTYFNLFEWALLIVSLGVSIFCFFYFHSTQYLYLIGSIVGFFAILLAAKGSPAGPFLMFVFSIFYGFVSFTYKYYGEMIVYLCVTAVIAFISFIAWLRHPSKEKGVVKTRILDWKEVLMVLSLAASISAVLFFWLKALNTANLILSIFSVFTSLSAIIFEYRRSKLFSILYMINDIILIVMWSMAAKENSEYYSLVVCFAAFFINDIYALISWILLEKRQGRTNVDTN